MKLCQKCGFYMISNFDEDGSISDKCINDKCGNITYSIEDIKYKEEVAKKNIVTNKTSDEYNDKEYCMIIINNIKTIRESKGLTQKDMAEKLGFTDQRYGTIERNTNSPTIILSAKIASKLNVKVNDLYDSVYITKEEYEKIQYLNMDYKINRDISSLIHLLANLKNNKNTKPEEIENLELVVKKMKNSLILKHGHVIERSHWDIIVKKFNIKIIQ